MPSCPEPNSHHLWIVVRRTFKNAAQPPSPILRLNTSLVRSLEYYSSVTFLSKHLVLPGSLRSGTLLASVTAEWKTGKEFNFSVPSHLSYYSFFGDKTSSIDAYLHPP